MKVVKCLELVLNAWASPSLSEQVVPHCRAIATVNRCSVPIMRSTSFAAASISIYGVLQGGILPVAMWR